MEIEEKRTIVRPVFVEAFCPYCHEELNPREVIYMTDPPQYKYSCKKCDFTTTSPIRYPYIDYEKGYNI